MKTLVLLSLSLLVLAAVVVGVFVYNYSHESVTYDLAAACPRTYENDFLVFQYSCGRLLSVDSHGESLIFTDFHQESGRSTKMYLWFNDAATGFSACESGENFSERKMTIPSVDGRAVEACYHEEHGGQTLTIPSDHSETGYVSINLDGGGLESEIIPSLKIK